MIQQTHQEQISNHEIVEGKRFGLGQLLITILKGCFGILGKMASSVAYGFTIFADSAEKHGLPRQ